MNKQPRLFSVFVALSLFLASGPLPAAAQVIGRVQLGAGSHAVVPVVPTIGGGIQAGSFSNASTPGIGLNGSFAAPSAALSPLVSAVPAAAITAPSALTVVTQQAAATPDKANSLIVPAPGGAATHIAQEAAAYAEVPAANAPAAKVSVAPVQKNIAGRILDTLLRRPAASVSFDGTREKSAPIFARMGLKEQRPLALPNGSAADEQPTVPAADLERTQVYAVPGAPGITPTSGLNRVVLEAGPADTDGILRALKARIDGEFARYGVSSSELRLVHAQRFEGRGEQADSIFFYFNRIKDGLVVHGHNLSFTVMVVDGRPQLVAEPSKPLSPLDVNTGTVLTDAQIMDRIAERTGLPPAQAATTFEFLEQKLIYSRGAWHNVKLYIADGLPFMVAVDVVTGLVFAWDNRTGLESFQAAPTEPSADGVTGKISGNTVDRGPILADSVVGEVPMPFMEVKIGAKSYVTDKNGALPSALGLEIGPEGLELTATLSGPHVRVENQQGKTLSIKVTVTPGENKVVFNPNKGIEDENTLAQVNAFHKVNLSLNFLRERKLSNERIDKTQLPVRTNVNDECNAYYTPGRPTLNFFRSSRNCVNSAYDTVAEHENGHFWDDFTGGIVNGGLSEGWGDMLSMFRLNNPIIGEHFLKQPRGGVDYIRHGENEYQYNEYDEVHDQGQAWGGFGWKLRKALIAKLGYDEGTAVADTLILPTMFAKASTIPDAMAQVLVNATTKTGTILHEAEIRAAAKTHGVNLPQAAAPTSARASWLKVSVKSVSIENLPQQTNQGFLAEATGADAIHRAPMGEVLIIARGLVTFSAGRLVRADALSYIRGYLDHFGVTYTIRRISGGGNGATYELAMTGNRRAIENITKTLQDGNLGY